MTDTNYVNFATSKQTQSQPQQKEFAALIHVTSSRFAKHEYSPDSQLAPKIGIRWIMGTTRGNTFERTWSTGIPWEGNEGLISPDGKRLAAPLRPSSDAQYLIDKVVNEAGFPSNKLGNDISVFEGNTFLMTTDQNARSSGSARKIYPKAYHPESWEQAKAAQEAKRAEREARETGGTPTATMTGSYTPPAVVIQRDVKKAAGDALVAILGKTGGAVTQDAILKGLNAYTPEGGWPTDDPTGKFRKEVTFTLWEYNRIKELVTSNPSLTIEGGPIGFTVKLNGKG